MTMIVLRVLWLAWAIHVCWDAAPSLLWSTDGGNADVGRQSATVMIPMAALALTVIALSFSKSLVWRRSLIVLSSLWALYFLASTLVGDEGMWWYARGIPFAGLIVSLLTIRATLPWSSRSVER
jgi:hypothetical protein